MSESLIVFKKYNGEKIGGSFEYDKKDKPLVNFLNTKAEQLIRDKISTIKTIYYNDEFIGYYSISMSTVDSGDLYDEKRSSTYSHPAILIGRLLVDKRFRGMHLGRKTIITIILLANHLNKLCACRFIAVDSKEDVVEFYKRVGFLPLGKDKQKNENTTTMLFDLK